MSKRRVLTGITTTGTPHLGNYVGAIRPAIAASRDPGVESFYFLADYHALVKCDDPARIQRSTLEIAASWLACGLDPDKVYFYRQSDIPEIPELTWLLTCVTAKGLLNRAHAYKAATDENRVAGEDLDARVTAGLFMYPVLMAADILLFNANKVPVGKDQIQHIEMARDIGQRFNFLYGAELSVSGGLFALPEASVEESVAVLPGLDGRKMSKSYDNTIPLWLTEQELKKAIQGIVTNSLGPTVPKNPDDSHLFSIYRAFANRVDTLKLAADFQNGISWGSAKALLFERINAELEPQRAEYLRLMKNPQEIEDTLRRGAVKVRKIATPRMEGLRRTVGIRPLTTTRHVSPVSMQWTAAKPRSSIRSSGTRDARFVTFRETDGTFKFKFLSGEGDLLMESVAFSNPAEIKELTKTIVDAVDSIADGVEFRLVDSTDMQFAIYLGIHVADSRMYEDDFARQEGKTELLAALRSLQGRS